jgi:hypothetical protein
MKLKLIAGLSLALLAGAAGAQTTPPQTTPPAGNNGAPAAGAARPRRALPPEVDPNAPATKYDYHELWAPFFYTKNGGEYRAADGNQGPKYWQNRADYQFIGPFK